MINDTKLEENLKKTRKQIDVTAEIYLYTLQTAIKIVDEKLPCYKEGIKNASLPSEKYDRKMDRQNAISTIVANLLRLSEVISV